MVVNNGSELGFSISKGDESRLEDWRAREWKKFNKKKGFSWDEKRNCLVAKSSGRILGYLTFTISGGVGYVKELIVSETARGRGIGSSLIIRAENSCRKAGCHKMQLESEKENIGFYKGKGWKVSTKLKNDIFHLTWYVMEKQLRKRALAK
ncbi:MAG: GNAT family N-acetyltransferase [archaeon]